MTSVRLEHISKRFGATVALEQINLQIQAGELFFLLGPSGCGKSTLLRLIAGLYEPTEGQIFFNDRDVTRLGTEKRNAVMCFQSYALWPHMSVRENIRFGLNVRHTPTDEQRQRVDSVLKLVQMEQYADRKPNQLSGGQQQRVALARALAVNPDCLLLDEPLSNLDSKLRQEMRSEIRRICKSAGFTTIYVTHDQKEALSVADRIAILKAGRLVQVGTPAELYHHPRTSFVADFIGQTNLLPGRVVGRNGKTVRIQTKAGEISAAVPANGSVPENVIVSIRPEQMRVRASEHLRLPICDLQMEKPPTDFQLQIANGKSQMDSVGSALADVSLSTQHSAPSTENVLVGRTVETTFLGEASEHVLMVNDQRLKVVSMPPVFQPPERMTVEFSPENVVLLNE